MLDQFKNTQEMISMSENKFEDILSATGPSVKRDLLDKLVFALVSDLNEPAKKEMLQTILGEQKGSQRLTTMVEH